jgi:hypothetical protein
MVLRENKIALLVRNLFVNEKYRHVAASAPDQQQGTVVSNQGGYGFIRPDGGGG